MVPTLNLQFFREFTACLQGLEQDFRANFKGITAKIVPHLSSIEFEIRETISGQKMVGVEFLLSDRDVTVISLKTGQSWTENQKRECFEVARQDVISALADYDRKQLAKLSGVRHESPALGGTS